MPLFEEFVKELEKVNTQDVDYIILYVEDGVNKEKSVIALKTGSIRQQLFEQGVRVYKYLGLGTFNVKFDIENIDDKYNLISHFPLNYPENDTQNFENRISQVYLAKKGDVPFFTDIVTLAVEDSVHQYIDHIICENKNYKIIYKNSAPIVKMMLEVNEKMKKYQKMSLDFMNNQ